MIDPCELQCMFKMDATDQLLLGGVCRQLGIVAYHPDVVPCLNEEKANKIPATTAVVPVVRVVRVILPDQSVYVPVKVTGAEFKGNTVKLEPDSELVLEGISMSPSYGPAEWWRDQGVVVKHFWITCK